MKRPRCNGPPAGSERSVDRLLATFPKRSEFDKAVAQMNATGLSYEEIQPGPAYERVGAPAVVMERTEGAIFLQNAARWLTCSGWVDCPTAPAPAPREPSPEFADDVFGRAAIMLLASCTGDQTRIRIVEHLSGNLAEAMPYLNAEMPDAYYNPRGPTLTFMDRYRMITLYARRIAVAKADNIVDAWRVLEGIRRRTGEAWARRDRIEPCHEMRKKPPALEIFKRLPGANCGQCGRQTCLAFAVVVWQGFQVIQDCEPVFHGEHADMKGALVEICAGLGVLDGPPETAGT